MTYLFGVFEFRAATLELFREGAHVRLEPQPARALALLLERRGKTVSRDELRLHLWGTETHVDFDRGLAYCIGQVRSALGDDADNPRFVQTLPRRGFRFLAPIEVLDPAVVAQAPQAIPAATSDPRNPRASAARLVWGFAAVAVLGAAGWALWPSPSRTRPIVAVAVFDNETGVAGYDSLVAAAADAVVDRLTALGPERLGVIGNAAVLRVPRESRDPEAIRRETAAGFLVIGQLQHDADGLRMLAHLIRLDDGTHLWVTRVMRAPADLAGIDAVIADRAAEAVRLHVVEKRPDAPRSTR